MKMLWNKIAHIGVDEKVDPSEIKYITLLNNLAVISFLLGFGFLPLFIRYFHESRIFFFIWIIAAPSCFFVLLFNYFKLHMIARVFFNMFYASVFLTASILGSKESSIHYLLTLVIIAAFFIYPPNRRKFMYVIVFFAFGSFVGLEFWFLKHGGILTLSSEFFKESSFTVNIIVIAYIFGFIFYIYTIYLRAEKTSESLLHNILPISIANRLKLKQKTIADGFKDCSVLFADIAGFTKFSEKIPPENLVDLLNRIFTEFDKLVDKYGLEKIKTIGDAYMVVAGLPEQREDHAEAIANFALDMNDMLTGLANITGEILKLRIGINSGPVVAGVIGQKKFIYDLWGDTVNTASRMESHGVPGEIQVTKNTYELLKSKYNFLERGKIEIKGKGQMQVYLLKGRAN